MTHAKDREIKALATQVTELVAEAEIDAHDFAQAKRHFNQKLAAANAREKALLEETRSRSEAEKKRHASATQILEAELTKSREEVATLRAELEATLDLEQGAYRKLQQQEELLLSTEESLTASEERATGLKEKVLQQEEKLISTEETVATCEGRATGLDQSLRVLQGRVSDHFRQRDIFEA